MTYHFEYEAEEKLDFDYEGLIKRVIEQVLDYEKCPYESEINIVLTNNEEIALINGEFRNIEKETDVLSFPMLSYDRPGDFSGIEEEQGLLHPETGELLLGDIMVSVEKVMEQAKEYGHSVERELGFLIAHSVLHLCGYDHIEAEERDVMERKQREIMDLLGLVR
ncbi:MAG: rRNA maturation RNase YbeY [Lachnospiraceae bacterium]|nr:rRNA maturation RNase YbeY [Lachnospiraceae bacterium]